MNRRSDAVPSAVRRAPTARPVRRLLRHESTYSWVTALLPALVAVSVLIDLAAARQRGVGAVALATALLVLAAIILAVGHRTPRWAGFAVLTIVTLAAILLVRDSAQHVAVNMLLITPMFGMYLGWFQRTRVARGFGFGALLVLLAAVLWGEQTHAHISSAVAAGHAVFITGFCFEAASYLRRRLERQAVRDPLTGALNRRGLLERAQPMIAAAHAAGRPVTLALIDFDDFKAVNDAGGHVAGDAALRETAESWSEGLGPADLVARVGGDEFVLLIHGDRERADSKLREIRGRAAHSWSWGLTQIRAGDTLDDLMKRADTRMYRVKDERES